MTDFEICSSFKGCLNRKEQINIIRDLSGKSKSYIFDVLVKAGLITESDTDYESLSAFCVPKKFRGVRPDTPKESDKKAKNSNIKPKGEVEDVAASNQKQSRRKVAKPKATKDEAVQAANRSPIEISKTMETTKEAKQPEPVLAKSAVEMPKQSMASYIEFQLSCGYGLHSIASSLGIKLQQVMEICAEFNIDMLGKPKALNLSDAKELVIKAYNYTTYVESCLKSGDTKYAFDAIVKQQETLNMLKSMLISAQHADAVKIK